MIRYSICLKFINQAELCPIALVGKIDLHNKTLMVQLQKYQNTFLLVLFVSPQIVQKVVVLTHFLQHVPHVGNTFKYINIYFIYTLHMSSVGLYKGKLVLRHDKTGCVSQDQSSLTV